MTSEGIMATNDLKYWQQNNSNIAQRQIGANDANNEAFVFGARAGIPTFVPWQGGLTALALGSPNHVALFDHFIVNSPSVNPGGFGQTVGDDSAATLSGEPGGVLKLVAGPDADDYVSIAAGLNWYTGAFNDAGYIYFNTNVKVGALADVVFEFGIADYVTMTDGFAFSDHSVDAVTSVADNATIFAFDPNEASPNWVLNTARNGFNQAYDTGIPVELNVWTQLGIVITPTGDALFYVGNRLIHIIEEAIALNVQITPWGSLHTLAAGEVEGSIDYLSMVGENPNVS